MNKLEKIKYEIIEYIYPRRCPICDEAIPRNKLICNKCRINLVPIRGKRCIKCSKAFGDLSNELCFDCRKTLHNFEYGFALYDYESVKSSLYRYKYSGRGEYSKFYSSAIVEYLGAAIKEMRVDAIIPVPLHKKRQQKRGYNQAELIAREIGQLLGIGVRTDIVYRRKNTLPQKKLSGIKRQNNLKKAFHIAQYDVKLKRVVIVDDIYTTGATINEVAKELIVCGVQSIFFITLSIGNELF